MSHDPGDGHRCRWRRVETSRFRLSLRVWDRARRRLQTQHLSPKYGGDRKSAVPARVAHRLRRHNPGARFPAIRRAHSRQPTTPDDRCGAILERPTTRNRGRAANRPHPQFDSRSSWAVRAFTLLMGLLPQKWGFAGICKVLSRKWLSQDIQIG